MQSGGEQNDFSVVHVIAVQKMKKWADGRRNREWQAFRTITYKRSERHTFKSCTITITHVCDATICTVIVARSPGTCYIDLSLSAHRTIVPTPHWELVGESEIVIRKRERDSMSSQFNATNTRSPSTLFHSCKNVFGAAVPVPCMQFTRQNENSDAHTFAHRHQPFGSHSNTMTTNKKRRKRRRKDKKIKTTNGFLYHSVAFTAERNERQ